MEIEKNTYLVRVSNLAKKISYKKIAQMVYNIDPCLYKDFFGSIENAVTFIEKALDTDFSIFNKNYLHLLIQEDKIIGTALIYSKNAEYFEKDEKRLLLDNKLNISANFQHVSEYYKNFINNNKGIYKLASISIDSNCRGQGFGKLLMKRIDEATLMETKYLTVLRENGRAIRTYTKSGYEIVKEFWDYYGVAGADKIEMAPCFSMVKSDKLYCEPLKIEDQQIELLKLPNRIITSKEYFENMSKNPKHFIIKGEFNSEMQK